MDKVQKYNSFKGKVVSQDTHKQESNPRIFNSVMPFLFHIVTISLTGPQLRHGLLLQRYPRPSSVVLPFNSGSWWILQCEGNRENVP
jgi:hypothetical protein